MSYYCFSLNILKGIASGRLVDEHIMFKNFCLPDCLMEVGKVYVEDHLHFSCSSFDKYNKICKHHFNLLPILNDSEASNRTFESQKV